MSEHEIAYWRAALQTAFQVAFGPAERTGDTVGVSIPGSRILITQAQLEASRMLRYLPRLPVQNAHWLQFAYQLDYQPETHRNLGQALYDQLAADQQLHTTTRQTFYQLCLAALTQARLTRQAVDVDGPPQLNSTALATLVGLANPSPTSWSRSRWAPRWRLLLAHIEQLDRCAIVELVELRRLIRRCQEITR